MIDKGVRDLFKSVCENLKYMEPSVNQQFQCEILHDLLSIKMTEIEKTQTCILAIVYFFVSLGNNFQIVD